MTSTPLTRCSHCDSGPFNHVSYDEELSAKTLLLRRELATSPRLGAAWDLERVDLRPSPQRMGYRGSVKLVFGWDKAAKEAVLGIYEPGSHRLVDLRHCREHDPRLQPLLEAVRLGVKEQGLPVYQPESGKGFLRYLLARVLPDGRSLLCFVTPHAEGAWQDKLVSLARQLRQDFPQLRSISQNLNPGTGNAVLGSLTQELDGQWSVPCTFLDTPVAVTGSCFLQANLPQFRHILETLRAWMEGFGPACRVADLYCGCGAIGLSVTHKQPLFLLESDHASQIPLMETARADGREEIGVTRGRVEDCLTSLELFEPDLILVDPPRKGLDPALVEELSRWKPRALAYLSCRPFTLARDLEQILADPTWCLEDLRGFDMMPGTEHLECLALLRRRDS